ncbi:PaaI family thioesterase [Quatrionicoccus australiensis]|uniref:PaaI family thioesterase n=1 Tax=Quatrionicoccus australiensis TaxID=138118 RepID=UPI001CF90EFB|nr:PaaI family thioesterase [Quatrionicoccus australiensis]UCV13991.1 PaaI family thioesterase [Quatrionicoccus australiensis]
MTDHPERLLVRRAIDGGLRDLAVDSNPLAISLGMRIVSASDGRVRLGFTVGTAFTQGNGVVQGGIVAALLDFAMIFAAFSQTPAGMTLATVSQTSNYFRPAPAGELFAEAELEKIGRSMVNARASLYGPDDSLLASATAPLAVIAMRT